MSKKKKYEKKIIDELVKMNKIWIKIWEYELKKMKNEDLKIKNIWDEYNTNQTKNP